MWQRTVRYEPKQRKLAETQVRILSPPPSYFSDKTFFDIKKANLDYETGLFKFH